MRNIIIATPKDCEALGIKSTAPKEIDFPTVEEILEYSGVDTSVGSPLVKKGFYGNTSSILYAPTDKDYQKLGLSRDSIIDSDGRLIYHQLKTQDGKVYVNDIHGNIADTFAISLESEIKAKGGVLIKLLNTPFYSRIVLIDPAANDAKERLGPRVTKNLFPGYNHGLAVATDSNKSGIACNGLEYHLLNSA